MSRNVLISIPDTQHNIWLHTIPNQALQIAPIASNISNVLDIGAGTGPWAIAFARRHPDTQVLGTDLSAIYPSALPSNCNFLVADAEKPWDDVFGGKKFDFIHSRLLCLGMHDWERYFKNCLEYLEQGGWVEIQEIQTTWYSDASSPSSQDGPFLRLGHLLTDSLQKEGIDGRASNGFKSMLESAGFVGVKEILTRWPVGDWSEDEREKLIGRMERENLENGLHGISLRALTKHGGLTAEEAERLVDEAKSDIAEDQADKRYYVPM